MGMYIPGDPDPGDPDPEDPEDPEDPWIIEDLDPYVLDHFNETGVLNSTRWYSNHNGYMSRAGSAVTINSTILVNKRVTVFSTTQDYGVDAIRDLSMEGYEIWVVFQIPNAVRFGESFRTSTVGSSNSPNDIKIFVGRKNDVPKYDIKIGSNSNIGDATVSPNNKFSLIRLRHNPTDISLWLDGVLQGTVNKNIASTNLVTFNRNNTTNYYAEVVICGLLTSEVSTGLTNHLMDRWAI